MASYVVPQVEIHQLFSEIPNSITQQQQAFIFGPNYRLNRFNVEDDADTYIGDYENKAGAETFAITNILDPDKFDKDYVKLYGRKAYVTLVDFTDTTATVTTDDDGETIVSFDIPAELTKANAFVGKYLVLKSGAEETDYMQILSAALTGTTLTVTVDEGLDVTSDSKTYTVTKIYEEQEVVEFPAKTSEEEGAVRQWSYADETITVNDLKVKIEDSSFVVKTQDDATAALSSDGYGDVEESELYVTFRELLTSKSETIHSISSASDVTDDLGALSPDNPLAQGVYNALLNAGGQTVRYMATPTDDLAGYQDVLQQAELTKDVYFLCPMTRDEAVIDLVQSHVNSMSEATTKRWRIAFVSMEIPDEVALYSSANKTSGGDWYAKVTVDAETKTATVTFNDDVGDCKFKKDITGNSNTLRANFNDLTGEYDTFEILKVVNNKTIRVDNTSGKLAATTEGIKVEIWHTYSNAEKATEIGDISSQLGDRRMYNIFPSVYNNNGVQYTGEFAAACVAGLVSSCLPQQPITNLQLVGIDDVPMVYQTFSLDDLNKMAAGGTFIVMQDSANDEVYVRHQISTAYEDNNLNTSELSITKNVDSISYSLDALLSPYIGKYNITPELLTTLHSVITAGLTKLGSDSYGLYGAQLILSETEILLLEQDALLKDHVNCNIQLGVPYPFNHLVLKLFV
jgi:hypothetical protein